MPRRKAASAARYVVNCYISIRSSKGVDEPAAPQAWQPGAIVVQETPPAEWFTKHRVLGSGAVNLGWARWYRLADRDGSGADDYLALFNEEVARTD